MEPAEASGWLKRRSEPTGAEAEPKAKGRSFRKEITSEELLTFGKHKGKTFKEALQKDPWYAIWCSDLPEQSLPMRRFLKYAEDQGVVQPSKRPKLEPKPTEAPLDVADAAIFDSFAFAPAVEQPGKHSAFSPHQQLPTSNAVSSPGNIYQQQATPQNSLPNQLQQHAMPQMPQQHPQTNQYQHPSGPQQNQQAVPQMLQQTQSPSQYQYQAARQSGQHVRPPNQQQIQQPSPQQSQRPNQFQQAPAPQMFPRNQSPNQYQHVPAAQFPPQNPPLNQQQAAPQMLQQNQSPSQYQYQAARQSGQNVPPNQQSPQQNQRPNQFQHAPAQFPPQNPPLNQQQAAPQMLQQNQSPSQYQYQAARQSGQNVPPPNQPVRPQMGHVAPPLSSPTTGGGLRVTPQEPSASEQARASRHFSPGATPQGLKNAALLEYDGTFEVELGRDKDGGVFTLLSSKKVGKKVFAELKRWPGAKVGPKLDFESRVYLEVVERLRDLYGSRSVKTPPEWVLTMLPDFRKYGALQVPKKVAHVLLADFKAPLLPADACSREGNKVLPYQREAVEFALSRGGRVLLGDEMGLGKTAQALTLASQFPKDFPLLVVCPSSLRGNWLEEASRWLPSSVLPDPEQHVQIVRKGSEKLRINAWVVVVSYDLVAAHETFRRTPAGRPYRMVICDEAHYLKSPSSQRSQALRPILQGARRCALLTGTPALAKASELYALLQSLLPGLLPDAHNKFCQRYCNEKKIYVGRRQVTQWEGSRLGDELHAILDMVMVRRFKSDVLHQLPAKRRQRVVLEKLSNDQGVLKELKEKMRDFQSHEDGSAPQGSAPELFRLTGLAKMAAVAEYVQYLVEAECRFLLFAHHQAVMDTMQQTLEKMKVGFIRIDGKTSSHRREELVNDFRSKKNLQVALLSITACGQGLNLQVCSTVVFAELHWTPGVLLQAEDRAHRMGQKESVNVHYLIAKDTLDESMYNMLERKQHDVGVMLDGQASRLGAQKVGPKGTFSKPDVEDSADAQSGAAEPSGSGTGSDTKGPKQQTLCFKKPQDVIVAPTVLEDAPLADATEPTDPIDVD